MTTELKAFLADAARDIDVIANNMVGDAEEFTLEACARLLTQIACDIRVRVQQS